MRHRHLYLVILLLVSIIALQANLASAQASIEAPSAREEIAVTPWGTIQVTRTYKLINSGSTTVSSIVILLPKDASDISATDDMGLIAAKIVEGQGGKNVTVTFRYSLRGEVGGVAYNEAYTFSLHYTLPSSLYLTQPEFGSFRLEFNASTGVEFPVGERTVVVTLPEGSEFLLTDLEMYNCRVVGLTPVISYTPTGLQPTDEIHVLVNYRFLPIWSAFRPTLWIGIVVAIVVTAYLLRQRSGKMEVREGHVDTELLRSFVNSLDEELGLWEDLDQLEEAFDNGRLGRKDYNRRRRILDNRIRSLSGSLSRLKQGVRQISQRYARSVERVETAEAEMAILRNDFSRLRSQFRAGRLSRSSFEDLLMDHRRRAGKVRAIIEAVIIELGGGLG